MTRLIFFGSLFILFYIYFGYPVLVVLLSKIRPKQVNKGFYQPNVTILIAAYNEEENIRHTIENKLELNYPKEKMEIIVISDASTDKTDDIVKGFTNKGVMLIRQEPRSGKTAALNLGVQRAAGEILVFSDSNSIYEQNALAFLVQNFNDPEIGYVTGKMIYTNPDGTVIGDGCSAYMKYENYLRKLETKVGSIVGVDGGVDAVRKSLYQPMNPDQLPDFILPLRVIEHGYRVVYEPMAILREPTLQSSKDEYKMRVRVSLRALWALYDMKHLLNIKQYTVFSLELFSHKYLRYIAFIFLICLYFSNMALWNKHENFKILFSVQNFFYLTVFLSLILDKLGYNSKLFFIPYYFTLINLASAHAFMKFFIGHKQIIWTPRKG
jgi:cellulose synthase/poly-beta-1,6-N-acetylglucosamine synthase-like glycosyltransferase